MRSLKVTLCVPKFFAFGSEVPSKKTSSLSIRCWGVQGAVDWKCVYCEYSGQGEWSWGGSWHPQPWLVCGVQQRVPLKPQLLEVCD